METMKRINKLTKVQRRALVEWMKNHRAIFEAGISLLEIAEMATTDLGFKVNVNHVTYAKNRKDAGIDVPHRNTHPEKQLVATRPVQLQLPRVELPKAKPVVADPPAEVRTWKGEDERVDLLMDALIENFTCLRGPIEKIRNR